jgi:hypothetical protein
MGVADGGMNAPSLGFRYEFENGAWPHFHCCRFQLTVYS